ncbi:MAG: hypothetical protein IT371_08660 [Deltaproteobacteria bacterium]|nr:hypothetical protein [Deltaproteobacteria bacterium]
MQLRNLILLAGLPILGAGCDDKQTLKADSAVVQADAGAGRQDAQTSLGDAARGDGSQGDAGPKIVKGPKGTFAGGEVATWAKVDGQGSILEVGVTVAAATLEGAAAEEAVFIEFAKDVQTKTFLNHLGFDFNPKGHGPPKVYDVPHFDFHFYGIDQATREAIDCKAEKMPEQAAIPAPFIIPGVGPEPDGTCAPKMGVHAIDPTSPEMSRSNPKPFTLTRVLGYTAGKLAFLEPMVTQAYLKEHKDFKLTFPAAPGVTTAWPTTVSGTYDATAKTWSFVLTDFVGAGTKK